ncbi:MAG TPA: M15 family metallopeptidase [Firmicutes bacterium]|uniref:D-alanyl-D-alanine dipeptidase n=1 Tax=Capillibacterium thermochitinicola TaxID=2699427 RepID=A0A8J6LM84_9FIRM|nr:M15 family metallopeptidase [Capillibacterium thermochitinicola]MBA2132708.1 M15 family metallopeptidase [Capillibacterium thermochitinicola]HHW12711.1 M15 family metallopeptidase [Bacillota bacterium]
MEFRKQQRQLLTGLLVIVLLWTALAAVSWAAQKADRSLPEGFVYVDEVIPDIVQELRYYGSNNFTGRPVAGYNANRAILTVAAAQALQRVQQELKTKGLGLKIFDGYRPVRAVNDFLQWGKDPRDQKMKEQYYPDLEKSELFKRGYIASRSAHSRGSTVDLTIIRLETGEELDMGSPFDFFGPISRHNSPLITEEQAKNRRLLRDLMVKHGFVPYEEEWWHYRLKNEPFPNTYFDFVIE